MAGYQGRGSKTGAKIIAKSVKAQGGRASAAKNAVKSAAKAAVFVYNPNKISKVANAARAVVTVKKTSSGIKKTGSIARKAKTESTSYRGKELTKAERAEIRKQNEAAESLKSKDLDKVEAGKKAGATRKLRQEEREDYAYSLGKGRGRKEGKKVGRIEGAAGTVLVLAAGNEIKKKVDKSKKKKK